MKLIFKALLIAFVIGVVLGALHLILSTFGNYIVAVVFYYLIIIPSALAVAVFKELLGVDLTEHQVLFLLIVVGTLYLLLAFLVYCLLWVVRWINAPE